MRSRISILLMVLIGMVPGGCRTRPKGVIKPFSYDKPLLPGQNALRKITNPLLMPDFTLACLDLDGLREATERSLNYLRKPSSRDFYPVSGITHYQAVRSLEAFAELLDSGLSGVELNAAMRERFDVYMSVGCDNEGTVLFTGYYTPIFDGSQQRTEHFRYPLNKQPKDLVKGADGEISGRRSSDGQIVPYPSRVVIEDSRMMAGSELVWLGDAFEAYIAHVQGSAKLRMPNGELMTVGYAASNGHEYRSISKELVKDGRLNENQLSLSAMIDFFRTHKELVDMYVQRNPRYIFFKKEEGEPRGSLNEPVAVMRTIATDKAIYPRGCLTFVSTALPQVSGGSVIKEIYSGFALDQDTGGAIRAPGRCDVYMGVGEQAGKLAGQTYQEGRLYYLFLKPKTVISIY